MIFIAALIGELLVLYFLARALTMHLSQLFYRIGFGQTLVMNLLAFLFLPGTFIHETSHYLFSVILRARVMSMSLLPQQEGNHIKMGTLTHEKVDLFRNLLIGSAPFIIGNLILYFLISFSSTHNPSIQNWITILTAFVVFQIGNSMFSSPADMEGSVEFLLIIAAIFGIAYFLGWRISWEQLDQSIPGSLIGIIKQADLFLLVPLVLDVITICLIYLLMRFSRN